MQCTYDTFMAKEKISVTNPYSSKLLAELDFATPQEISAALTSSVEAFQKWRISAAWERADLLNRVADRLQAEKAEFAQLICEEAGKPIQLAKLEVDRGLNVLRWAAAETQRFSGELLRLDASASGRSGFGLHTRFPKGAVLGITPYNFPLNLVLHKIAPALACGCSIVIKPSVFTPLTAQKLISLFDIAPKGLVQCLLTNDADTAKLTQAPEVAHISFTGSARVGWMIRRQAPEKSVTLELGGNAWVVILEDTPESLFPAIAKRITGAAFGYAGQSCISVQNVAVADSHWNRFSELLRTATENIPFGDPANPSTVAGPLIHAHAAEKVRAQLEPFSARSCQSKNVIGGLSAAVITPTLVSIESSENQSPLVQEEIFAPVMTMQKFTDIPKIIETINASRYGLQTGVYTQNWAAIERLYRDLNVGGVIVNDVPTTRYDHQPYGGIKDSGQGREGIKYVMEELTEAKFLALSSQVL